MRPFLVLLFALLVALPIGGASVRPAAADNWAPWVGERPSFSPSPDSYFGRDHRRDHRLYRDRDRFGHPDRRVYGGDRWRDRFDRPSYRYFPPPRRDFVVRDRFGRVVGLAQPWGGRGYVVRDRHGRVVGTLDRRGR